jgi:hypothetical protein
MAEITTAFNTALDRALDRIIDDIAIEGVKALQVILDDAGFSKSPYLKNYEIYANVMGQEIVFEILLDMDSVEYKKDLEEKQEEVRKKKEKKLEDLAARTYGLTRQSRRVTRIYHATDMRRPARDARKGARDARKGAAYRLARHEMINKRPRSAHITRQGKLSIEMKRSVRETETKIHLPQGDFEGVIKDIITKLKKIILDKFLPELSDAIQARFGKV